MNGLPSTIQIATRYCYGCQRHQPITDFKTHQHTCASCVSAGRGEQRRELIVQRSVVQLLREVTRDTGKLRDKKDWMERVVGGVASPEELDRLCSRAILRMLENEKSWKANLDAVKLIRDFKSLVDEGQDRLKDNLAKLSDEDLLQLGLGLVTRAMADTGNIELLEELAAQFGYRLVPLVTVQAAATLAQEAVA